MDGAMAMHGRGLLALILFLAGLGQAAGAEVPDLYQARAVISGQSPERRALGFALCLPDVLVKVSGDASLPEDRRVAEAAARAGDFISGFQMRDRLSGKPLHDEQGS